jgi:hypothetical protein
MDGWAFRREQRDDPALSSIPVVVVSGADADVWSTNRRDGRARVLGTELAGFDHAEERTWRHLDTC